VSQFNIAPDLPGTTPYSLSPAQPIAGTSSLLRPPIAVTKSTGILTCFPSATPFGLTLGADLPCVDERCARKPWTFGVRDFHSHYRYSCQHSHFRYLQLALQQTFTGLRNAPLPRILKKYASAASVISLSPVKSSAQADSTSELLRFL
jgi:hypothetical protein